MVISWLPVLLVVFLMVFLIVRAFGSKGKPVLSEPYCAKCGYDLRVNWDSSMVCPECGADLKAKGAVNFGKVKKRSIWWTILIYIGLMALLLLLLVSA